MFQRPESVQRPPYVAPLRHPYFETHRQQQAAAFRREIREFVAKCDQQRQRLAEARILESVH